MRNNTRLIVPLSLSPSVQPRSHILTPPSLPYLYLSTRCPQSAPPVPVTWLPHPAALSCPAITPIPLFTAAERRDREAEWARIRPTLWPNVFNTIQFNRLQTDQKVDTWQFQIVSTTASTVKAGSHSSCSKITVKPWVHWLTASNNVFARNLCAFYQVFSFS